MNTTLRTTIFFVISCCITSSIDCMKKSSDDISLSWKKDLIPVPDNNLDIFNAVECNDISKLRYLIAHRTDLNQKRTEDEFTALHLAAKKNYVDMVITLVVNGATVDVQDKHGNTPLHIAAHSDHKNIVSILITSDAQINMHNKCKDSPLHWAAKFCHFETGRLLLDNKKINVNIQNEDGYTPLHVALYALLFEEKGSKAVDFISLLLDHNAQISIKNKLSNRPDNLFTNIVLSPHDESDKHSYNLMDTQIFLENKEYRFKNHNLSKQQVYNIVSKKRTPEEIAIHNEIIKKEKQLINQAHNLLFCKGLEDLEQYPQTSKKYYLY